MKSIFITLSLILLTGVSHSQALQKGNFVLDAYYGFPNLGASLAKVVINSSSLDVKIRGIGPAGIRGEYLLSDKFGIGMDIIYNSNNIQSTQRDSTYNNSTNTYDVVTNSFEYSMRRLRVQVRMNFHFEIENPALDVYFGVGVGTNNRFRKSFQNGVEVKDDVKITGLALIPVSMRICTGFRYYFTENFGLNLEIGLGGPVISGGLSLKF